MLLILALGIYLCKALIVGMVTIILGFPLRTGIIVGIGLGQIGEFSFVLSRVGVTSGLFDAALNQGFLAVAVLGMAATTIPAGRRATTRGLHHANPLSTATCGRATTPWPTPRLSPAPIISSLSDMGQTDATWREPPEKPASHTQSSK